MSEGQPLRVISFGGGVQTTALAILNALGLVENPARICLFADTGDEKPETYEYLEHVFEPWAVQHGLEFITVCYHRGQSLYGRSWQYRMVPSILSRWCTSRFKTDPINKWLREHGANRTMPADMQIGISADESGRAVDSQPRRYVRRRWPLVELGMTRIDCLRIILTAGLPEPVKSSCWYCPFQSRRGWLKLANDHPDLISRAIQLERNAMSRNPRDFLGVMPLERLLSGGRQLGMDEFLESEAGCRSGQCFV